MSLQPSSDSVGVGQGPACRRQALRAAGRGASLPHSGCFQDRGEIRRIVVRNHALMSCAADYHGLDRVAGCLAVCLAWRNFRAPDAGSSIKQRAFAAQTFADRSTTTPPTCIFRRLVLARERNHNRICPASFFFAQIHATVLDHRRDFVLACRNRLGMAFEDSIWPPSGRHSRRPRRVYVQLSRRDVHFAIHRSLDPVLDLSPLNAWLLTGSTATETSERNKTPHGEGFSGR